MYVLVFNRAYFSFNVSKPHWSQLVSGCNLYHIQLIAYCIRYLSRVYICFVWTSYYFVVTWFLMLQIILLTHILWSCSEFNLTAPLCTVFISCLPSFGCMNWERKTRQWKMIYAAKPNKFNWLLYRNVSKLNILSIHEGILCWFTRNDDYFNQNFTSRFECEYQKTMNMLKKLWKCGFQNGCENNPQDFHQNWPRSDFR